MPSTTTDPGSHGQRGLRVAVHGLLVLAFLTGGSSQISGWDDTVVQLLALPVLAFALWRIGGLPASTSRNLALGIGGLLALVPLVQLLPIPEALWAMPPARRQLAADLAVVGASPALHWSLAPAATLHALLFLLSPLAVLAGTLALPPTAHRGLLRTVMLLALSSLVLAFLQLGVPAESVLNPFPRWASQFNGVFANQNHQGISLVVGMIIALSGALAALRHARDGLRQAWTPWVLGFIALFCLCALPLTNSRASVLIGTFAVALVPLSLGLFDRAHLQRGWGARVGLLASLALIALGAWATVGWMQVDMVDELRGPMREAAFAIGSAHAPLGVGVGAFVEAFAQGMPEMLVLPNYINHAHNEYAQWWMEAGWLAVAVGIIVAASLAWLAARALRQPAPERLPAVAATLALAALLAHSWVDYPMRTVSLATVAGVLLGVVATGARRRMGP